MSDFIMTLSSDDEATPSVPVASTSKSARNLSATKSTRKQQLQQSKKNKLKVLQKKNNKKGQSIKRNAIDDVSDLEEQDDSDSNSDSDAGSRAQAGQDDEGLKMSKDFVFDGLGGGFVGERRNNVWVSVDSLLFLSYDHLGKLNWHPHSRLRRMEGRAISSSDQTQL